MPVKYYYNDSWPVETPIEPPFVDEHGNLIVTISDELDANAPVYADEEPGPDAPPELMMMGALPLAPAAAASPVWPWALAAAAVPLAGFAAYELLRPKSEPGPSTPQAQSQAEDVGPAPLGPTGGGGGSYTDSAPPAPSPVPSPVAVSPVATPTSPVAPFVKPPPGTVETKSYALPVTPRTADGRPISAVSALAAIAARRQARADDAASTPVVAPPPPGPTRVVAVTPMTRPPSPLAPAAVTSRPPPPPAPPPPRAPVSAAVPSVPISAMARAALPLARASLAARAPVTLTPSATLRFHGEGDIPMAVPMPAVAADNAYLQDFVKRLRKKDTDAIVNLHHLCVLSKEGHPEATFALARIYAAHQYSKRGTTITAGALPALVMTPVHWATGFLAKALVTTGNLVAGAGRIAATPFGVAAHVVSKL